MPDNQLLSPSASKFANLRVRDEDIANQEDILNKRMLAASEPRKNSLQDALISAAIQIAPALLGYAASGKSGALSGLQGGATGGKIYEGLLEDDYKTEQQQNTLLASQAQKDLQRLQGRKDKQDDRAMSLEGSKELAYLKEDLRRGRPQRPSSMDTLANSIGQLAKKLGENEADGTEATEETTPTGNSSVMISELQNLIADSKKSNIPLEDMPAFQKIVKGGLDIKQKDKTLEKTVLEVSEKERTEEALKSPRVLGFTVAFAKKGINPKRLSEIEQLSAGYSTKFKGWDELAGIMNSTNIKDRLGFSKGVKTAIDAAVNKIVEGEIEVRMSALEGKTGTVSEKQRAKIREEVSKPGGILGEVNNIIKTVAPGDKFRTAIDGMIKSDRTKARTKMSALNFHVPDPAKGEVAKTEDGIFFKDHNGNWYDIEGNPADIGGQ